MHKLKTKRDADKYPENETNGLDHIGVICVTCHDYILGANQLLDLQIT